MPAPATAPTDPDALAVLHVLSSTSSNREDVYNALEGLRHMAGHAIAAALEIHKAELAAKIDSQNARFDAQSTQFDALKDQLTRERRILWTLVALLGVAVLRSLIAG